MSRSSRNSEKRSSRNDFYRGDDKTERRALFNPQSDHPIGFNRPLDSTTTNGTINKAQPTQQSIRQRPSTRSSSSSSSPAPTRRARGVLWDPNSSNVPPLAQPTQSPKKDRPAPPLQPETAKPEHQAPKSVSPPKAKATDSVDGKMSEHRSHLKMLLSRIQKLEAKATQLSEKSLKYPYFQGILQDHGGSDRDDLTHYDDDDTFYRGDQRRTPPDHSIHTTTTTSETTIHPWLTMDNDQWHSTDQLWRDRMTLHLQLSHAYLDVMQFDYGFAEKKNLFSLCWKRAIYSLVEQFRQAFRRQQMLVAVVEAMTTDDSSPSSSNEEHHDDSDDDDDDDDHSMGDSDGDFIPVMTENGMTLVQLSDDDDDGDGNQDRMDKTMLQKVLDKHLHMLRTWMDTFLLVADGFYQQAMVVLRDLDIAPSERELSMAHLETSLHRWWRTKRWKWYQCIPYRGDLARYRFIYGQKKKDYELAWRWYTLGVWLIPATGRFYFHQSLLLNSPQYSPLYELHKLYFGVRSLMVRRNGFVNAREGLVTLFENNRQWQAAAFSKKKGKRRNNVAVSRSVEPDKMICGLFIRLHGMLFTKIDLDSFAQTKRHYFETLFRTPSSASSPSSSTLALSSSPTAPLSGQHLFWLETILLNLSSVYSYDYASSTFTTAALLNKKTWVSPGEAQQQQQQDRVGLLETLGDSILFGHSIDLVCQVVIELLSRYLRDDDDDDPAALRSSPSLPALPPVSLSIKSNERLLFGSADGSDPDEEQGDIGGDPPWMIYIYVLLHWMVVTGVGVRSRQHGSTAAGKSIWESTIGQVASSEPNKSNNVDKITRTFWSLLMAFLTRLLKALPETTKYQLIDRHLLDSSNPWADEDGDDDGGRDTWDDYLLRLLGPSPVLPEDDYLRGLGWLDDLFSSMAVKTPNNSSPSPVDAMALQRRIRILDFGFTLVKQMHEVLEYDPVQELFVVKTMVEEEQDEALMAETDILPILTALDDAVLFDSTMPLDDDDLDKQMDNVEANHHDNEDGIDADSDDDDMVGQLKKRRQHLQSMLATMTQEKKHADTYGYQKLYMTRGKEREARLNRIREKVIPGQTVLVLDTNCFIGHIDAIRKLIQGGSWSIVIPLVVITELDGLKGNAPPLGTVAGKALELIETTLASKQLRRDVIRIQTSHHNFMYDISIRSEQFIFGETDKNLDDLILSTCLWWKNNKKLPDSSSPVVPVCLVTADRNLSVKARARDVQVIPVSGLMEISSGSPSRHP